jgi:hypothetical protein
MTHEIPHAAPAQGHDNVEHGQLTGASGHGADNVNNIVADAWSRPAAAREATAADSGKAAAAGAEKTASGTISISDNQPAAAPPAEATHLVISPFVDTPARAPLEVPAPIQQAIDAGTPIHFSSAAEDQAAGRQPDYFFTPEGQFVPNPKATPSSDGSLSVQIQSSEEKGNQSLRDAITHENQNQRAAAKDMIRLFQKAHPGMPVPSWMQDLADAKPNLPDFVPFKAADNAPVTPPPENGFAPRGVGGGGSGGFAGNGGFDSKGYFHGNGGKGDGAIPTGGTDSRGAPIGPGEQVQAKQLYDYFVEHGFSPAQASGILGNIQTESSFKTNAYNAGEGAIGLCQWEGGRRTELERFAANQGKPVTEWRVQADFIMHELNTTESRAYTNLKAATTPEQAAKVFQSQYERSASLGNRAANASNIYSKMA